MEKNFVLPRQVIALAGVASKNQSRAIMAAVHFDGKNAMATDGHRLVVMPCEVEDLKGVSLNLAEVNKPKASFIHFVKTGENRFLSEVGAADVVEGTPPAYKNDIMPIVSPDTHQAVAINADYLIGLYKAIDSENKGDKKGILTLLIKKGSSLDPIGVVSSNSSGIGLLMPCRPFGGAGFPNAFQKFADISGQNTLEGQMRAVEELKRQVDADEVGITPEIKQAYDETEIEQEASQDEWEEVEEIRARFMEALRNEAKAAIEDVWSGLAEDMRQEIEDARERHAAEAETEEEAAPLSSDVAAVFKQDGEVADAFKQVAQEV